MGPRRTLVGAWLVLRANQVWAPYPDNDPDAARDFMRRFYAMVKDHGDLAIDPVEAARREVDWWRIHRVHQREEGLTENDLVDAVADLYSYVYAVPGVTVREAAGLRVAAMGPVRRVGRGRVLVVEPDPGRRAAHPHRVLFGAARGDRTSKGCRRTGARRNSANLTPTCIRAGAGASCPPCSTTMRPARRPPG